MTVVSLSEYGKDFQTKLISLLIEDTHFFLSIFEILKEEFFVDKMFRSVYKLLLMHFTKYEKLPTYDNLSTYVKLVKDVDIQNLLYKTINSIEASNNADADFVKDTAFTFCKHQKIKESLIKMAGHLKSEQFDSIENEMMDVVKKVNTDVEDHDYWSEFDDRAENVRYNVVSTGWPTIDEEMQGGLAGNELGVIIGGPGAGKSMVLVHLGAAAVKAGKNIVHITLELGKRSVGTRYDSWFTKYPIDKIPFFRSDVKEKLMSMREGMGSLKIQEYPTKSASILKLKAYVNKLKATGFKADMIIIDYADLLRPSGNNNWEKRLQLEEVYEDLRGWAGELQIPIWTASQSNRSSVSNDYIGIEDIAESFNKVMISDVIVTLARRIDQRLENQGTMFIAKNRAGRDGLLYPVYMDTSIVEIKVNTMDINSTKDILSGTYQKNAKINGKQKEDHVSKIDELFN